MAGNINEFLATKKSALFVEAINQFGRLVDWIACMAFPYKQLQLITSLALVTTLNNLYNGF